MLSTPRASGEPGGADSGRVLRPAASDSARTTGASTSRSTSSSFRMRGHRRTRPSRRRSSRPGSGRLTPPAPAQLMGSVPLPHRTSPPCNGGRKRIGLVGSRPLMVQDPLPTESVSASRAPPRPGPRHLPRGRRTSAFDGTQATGGPSSQRVRRGDAAIHASHKGSLRKPRRGAVRCSQLQCPP
jgi:hypothetical protein